MNYPKIGIRPVIDGRWGGVRESLEAQTMGMAEAAAKLISENLRYPDGTPFEKDCRYILKNASLRTPPSVEALRQPNVKQNFPPRMYAVR